MRHKRSSAVSPPLLFVQVRRFPSRDRYATWLFEFLRATFTPASSPETLEWQAAAKDFVDLGEGVIVDLSEEGGLSTVDGLPTVAVLKVLQQELQTALDKRWQQPWPRPALTSEIAWAGDRFVPGSRRGSFRDLFVWAMQTVVLENGIRLRQCPQCGRVFLKTRKQQYCSPVCSQKTRWARYAAKRPKRDYPQEYERTVRKKVSAATKVKPRRPRHGHKAAS